MSFLDFKTLNSLLQTCKKAQMHFHVRGLRYESSINERYPTYWNMSRIGDGGGGVVFKVRDPKAALESKDSFVALKVVRKNIQYGFAVWKRLRTEIDLQLKIDHPNIAKLLDVFQTPDEVVLVIEAGDGGSLRNQSAAALVYLRDLKIAHRDIKCDNIVLSDDFSRVMMIDFGLAELLTSDRQGFTPCGTVGFASPENIAAVAERRAKFYADIGVMHKADMFSLGVVAFMMLSSTKPFKGSRFPEMHREVQQGLRCEGRGWGHVSSAAKMLVERMLRGDATARASAEEVMQDPWVLEGCKRFKDVIARRQEDLKKQRDQLEAEFDMPTFERTTNKNGNNGGHNKDGVSLPDDEDGIWMLEGEQCESAQARFVP
jgi:serine/threonine protein kinase